jgi:RNA polymerase sigma-70 factor (ECF subfamily)
MDRLSRLALDAAAGDAEASEHLVRESYPDVWRLCATLVDRPSADDLAQESFSRAFRGLAGYRGDSSVRTWLLSVARHTCIDELRSRQRRRRHHAPWSAVDADHQLPTPDASHESTVGDLLARLDPDRRAAFVLTQQLGLTYAEAGAVYDCPPGTIRSRVARARAELVELLGDEATARAHDRRRSSPA